MLKTVAARAVLVLGITAFPAVSPAQETRPGPPPEIEQQIRRIGPKVDPVESGKIYKSMLEAQPRDGVKRTNDVAYGPDERNKLDVFVPEKAAGPMPVAIFVHGGGFLRGDKSDRDNVGTFFARNGVIGLVPSYRLAPKNQWPAGAEDIAAVVRWGRANVAALGGDPERIFVTGESAGAAHVAAALLMKRFSPEGRLPVAGAVLVSGVYDAELERLAARQFGMGNPDPRNGAYFGTDAASLPAKSTLRNIDAPEVPLLITYAELDPVQMQVQAGALFTALCNRSGKCPDITAIRGHGHISQVLSINTGDMSLAGPMLDFVTGKR